ncbi:MAG: TonB-dependent receptor [Candidatus Krumholzibacteria bacterium]|nr:TonB-dependent receptor [Candidatus Krumholzibacteria bacterium]
MLLCFLVVALFAADVLAAGNGILKGKVVDYQTQKPIPQAIVAIQGSTKSVMADRSGIFQIELPAGKYGISILKEDYYNTCYQDVEIEPGKITTYKCELVSGDPRQQFFFAIGGITVLDKKDILPQKIETTHEISSAEIEHYLSTNLGDIMDMVPGVERTKNPGLSSMTQLDLRGSGFIKTTDEQSAARFGTKVIVDDISISNNANMTTGTGTGYGSVNTYAGTGVDLRAIPADNINNVEVVTGVPSAEYGDLTTGLVKVKTKIGAQPMRLKLKSNPDTKESNLNGGWNIGDMGISYNANYAWSERNIRLEGDEYSRYNGQLTVDNKLFGSKLDVLNKIYYTGVKDEYNPKGSDALSRLQSNKDKTIMYGHTVTYKPNKDMKLDWTANVNYTKRDSYAQSLVGADVRVLSDAMKTGTQEGFVDAGAYVWKVWTRGEEWSVGAKLKMSYDVGLLHLNHSLMGGSEYSFDDNVGQGKIFNPLEPPYGDLGYRPLSFDAVPGLHTANVFLEDEINGFLLMRPYSVNLGCRYEMYSPYKLHLDGIFNEKGIIESKNGTYINPRVRLKYEPFEGNQVRFGWGKSSKMPSINDIFQGPYYVDVVEENVSPPDSVPLVSTYVFNYDNRDIKGYQQEKTELSVDQKIGPVGVILTGFYSRSSKVPRALKAPITVSRYRWTEWPSSEGKTAIDTIYTDTGSNDGYYGNVGWSKSYGLETQIVTKRIEKLSASFRISSSLVKSRSGADGIYMNTARVCTSLGKTIYPFYYYTESWGRKMIIDYSADWFIKKVGMWITFYLQQTLFNAYQSPKDPYVYSTGYYDPEIGHYVSITPEESDALSLTKEYTDLELAVHKTPNDRLLFNINVSKSVGKSAEISFFVHNLLDDASYYLDDYGIWQQRNPDIFYGVEFSMVLDDLWRHAPKEAAKE